MYPSWTINYIIQTAICDGSIAGEKVTEILTTKQFVYHGIMQLVFTVDVIDCIYLAIKQRDFEPKQSSDQDQN